MVLVGIDWAEAEHAVCVLSADGSLVHRLLVPHTPAGVRTLQRALGATEPDPSAILVAIERPDGLLVEALVAAGYTVYALNPKLVERYRGRTRTAGAKSDPADAELLARILLTDRDRHQPLRPASAQAAELRALARQDERASRDLRRLLNRLRADLLAVYPQALAAFPDLDSVAAWAFLERWPTAAQAQQVSPAEIEALLRTHFHSQPRRAATRIYAALHTAALSAADHLVRAKASSIQLAAQQVRLIQRQRTAWENRMRVLLTGADAHPDGELLLSLPGLDARLAARVLGEIGECRTHFPTPSSLQCYAGTAPVTKSSGKTRRVAARRACNHVLRQALLRWAFCSLPRSAWAHRFYDQHRATGNSHYQALRALANRWLEILHHLLHTAQHYDEQVHQRNRSRPPLPHAA
jgi:transposase